MIFSLRNLLFSKSKFVKISPLLSFIHELANKYHVDSSQIAIMWAASKGTVPIVGVTKPSHVEQLATSSQISLDQGDIIKLENLAGSANLTMKGTWEPKN